MNKMMPFLAQHSYVLLFAWVFADQVGVPVPSIPMLVAAGALARTHRLNIGVALGLALFACFLADGLWYQLGRHQGMKVLKLLCRISLEPDSCVRTAENTFARHGARSLLVAKFVPGLSTVAPPLAGVFRMRLAPFLLYDGLGSFLWAVPFLGLGYLFSDQLERAADYGQQMGSWLIVLLAGALAAYLTWKYIQRRRFIRYLAIARITPEALKAKLDAGEDIVIVDLRHAQEFEAEPSIIPGALHLSLEELDQRYEEIPRDREVVLYCT
jgi:membrane protein DedA with SNARE-associated domain